MIWIYRLVAYPLMDLTFWVVGFFNPKIRAGLKMRDDEPWLKFPAGTRPYWIHCASGEFEYAKPVINAIKSRDPSSKILVTYFSPSIESAVRSHKQVDFACPLPWDRVSILHEFISHHQPRALLVARTDVWPEMILQARSAKVPSLLFSATLADNSGRMRGAARPITKWTLSHLNAIHCVATGDQSNFEKLGLKAQVCGDTRFDQVIARLKSPKPIKTELFASEAPLFVAGSTWSEDENELIPLMQHARKKMLGLRFVLVPHEPTPDHLQKLEADLQAGGFQAVRYSKRDTWPPETILIVDQVGILADIYAYARLAFVGGSFRKTVHSVMEALASGCITFVGPFFENNREAIAFQKVDVGDGLHAVEVLRDRTAANELLEEASQADFTRVRQTIQENVARQAGQATGSVLAWLDSLQKL